MKNTYYSKDKLLCMTLREMPPISEDFLPEVLAWYTYPGQEDPVRKNPYEMLVQLESSENRCICANLIDLNYFVFENEFLISSVPTLKEARELMENADSIRQNRGMTRREMKNYLKGKKLETIENILLKDDAVKELGIRKVVAINEKSLLLRNENNHDSELRWASAKLIECSEEYVRVYEPALRLLTQDEIKVLKELNEMEREYNMSVMSVNCFLKKRNFEYLSFESKGRLQLNRRVNLVRDNGVRGKLIITYKIHE